MIKSFYSKLMFLLALLVGTENSVWADTDDETIFMLDGICYQQMKESGWQDCVYVIENPFKYTGDIVVPDSVAYDGKKYRVFGIADNSFKDCSEMTSIQINADLAFIGNYAFENCIGLQEFTTTTTDETSLPYWGGYETGNRIGYRAFYGCHFKTFTITCMEPPRYKKENPTYTSGITNEYCQWFEDYWETNTWPPYITLQEYTTLYVPAGAGPYYKEVDENDWGPYRNWHNFFTKIKEWGAENDDSTMGMKYDTIPELKHYTDSLVDIAYQCSVFAYWYLLQYVDSLAASEGTAPDYTRLEEAFSKKTIIRFGNELEERIIPSLKRITEAIEGKLATAEQRFNELIEPRRNYYISKKNYENVYNRYDWEHLSAVEIINLKPWLENMKTELENERADLYQKIKEARNYVFSAGVELADCLSIPNLFEKEMWDFINAFKMGMADIHAISDNTQQDVRKKYSLSGIPFKAPRKGVNIVGRKKVVVR